MRAIRTTTISILALGLLAGSAVGVAAQEDEADPMRASTFKWNFGDAAPSEQYIEGTVTETDYGSSYRGETIVDLTLEAGDPRASGLFTIVQNVEEMGRTRVITSMGRIVNDAGAWSGSGAGVLRSKKNNAPQRVVTMAVLTGEGAYEGLTLVLTDALDDARDYNDARGYIIAAEQPPVPELPAEPPAE